MRFRFTGVASGLNCTMPKGMVAPGKTLPPLVVPTSGLTREAGSGWPAKADGEASRAAMRRCEKPERRATCMTVGYGMWIERVWRMEEERCERVGRAEISDRENLARPFGTEDTPW